MSADHILIIDDELAMLRSVARVLAPRHEVDTASSAEEALEKVRSHAPDLAIVDIRMPEMDGFELMRILREEGCDSDVIVMTGVIHELDSQQIRSIREGAFYFIQKPFDRDLLLALVDRCLQLRRLRAAILSHTERLERQLEEARIFQHSLLPGTQARIAGVSLAARYESCEKLGGDFYDFLPVGDDQVALLIADVAGHGVSAAMITAIVKSAFHDAREESYEPLAVVRHVARALQAFEADRFVTLFCGRVDGEKRTLEYVNAGHPAPLLWGPSRALRGLAGSGPMVCSAFPELDWKREVVTLEASDRVLLYTDGLIEARGPQGLFGEERLMDLLRGTSSCGEALLGEILAAVRGFSGGRPPEDDCTLVTFGWD